MANLAPVSPDDPPGSQAGVKGMEMTIVELRDRLTQIIESNEKHGWAERNESDVVVHHQVSKLVHEYLPVEQAVSYNRVLAEGTVRLWTGPKVEII